MTLDQEIADGVESVLRSSVPKPAQNAQRRHFQLEAKLGRGLERRVGFIRHISYLLQQQQLPQFVFQRPHFQQQPQVQNQNGCFQFGVQPHFRQDPYFGWPVVSPPAVQERKRALVVDKEEGLAGNIVQTPIQTQSVLTVNKRKSGSGGVNKVCVATPELEAVVGSPALPRTEILKQLWAYIKRNNLQDPSNERKIICDDALRVVFETDCTDMFKMNKLLSKHIVSLEPTKESCQAKRLKVNAELNPDNNDLGSSQVRLSNAFCKFLGTGERYMSLKPSRGVWDYVKVNELEDPSNPMAIICDSKLRELIGCPSISALGASEVIRSYHLSKPSGSTIAQYL